MGVSAAVSKLSLDSAPATATPPQPVGRFVSREVKALQSAITAVFAPPNTHLPDPLVELIADYITFEPIELVFAKALLSPFAQDPIQRAELTETARLRGAAVTHIDLSRLYVSIQCMGDAGPTGGSRLLSQLVDQVLCTCFPRLISLKEINTIGFAWYRDGARVQEFYGMERLTKAVAVQSAPSYAIAFTTATADNPAYALLVQPRDPQHLQAPLQPAGVVDLTFQVRSYDVSPDYGFHDIMTKGRQLFTAAACFPPLPNEFVT